MKFTSRTYTRLLQTTFFLLAAGFLWLSLTEVRSESWQKIGSSILESPMILSLVVLLMPLNWLIESKKWQQLNQPFREMKLTDSIRAVLAGTYLSLFSPNRIGDLAGRVYLTPKGNRKKATTASFYGSTAQLTITVLLGILGILFLVAERGGFEPLLAVAVLGSALFVIFCYFNLARVYQFLLKVFPRKWNLAKNFHLKFDRNTAAKTLLYSAARYLIFSFQFTLLLLAFGIQLPLIQIFAGIATVYLISAIIPTALLGELGIRESVALFVFGFWSADPAGIFAATFTLWLINLVVPAIFGSYSFNKARNSLIGVKS